MLSIDVGGGGGGRGGGGRRTDEDFPRKLLGLTWDTIWSEV